MRPVKFLLRGGTPTQTRAVDHDLCGVPGTVTVPMVMLFFAVNSMVRHCLPLFSQRRKNHWG
jgi:hypothetical protein